MRGIVRKSKGGLGLEEASDALKPVSTKVYNPVETPVVQTESAPSAAVLEEDDVPPLV